jgi:hypothetical protein
LTLRRGVRHGGDQGGKAGCDLGLYKRKRS